MRKQKQKHAELKRAECHPVAFETRDARSDIGGVEVFSRNLCLMELV